ncbi:MAG: histidine phosphatase family protein [Gammaproteobacteria bacterium SHHR-1]|uniref:histidine phosphatase family protein n=1 Tax=Magnetovirga frankeli TaxID=947516 RepID=UPI0012933759|nr:histidine phosphatase family protein [gamma proteobacterium SS-5]
MIAALIRHADYRQLADTPSAHQPFPLTEKGRAQAAAAAGQVQALLHRHGWRLEPVIDSSCLLRGWQTAQILAERLEQEYGYRCQLESFEDLAERGLGSAANLSLRQIEQVLEQDPRYPVPPANWKSDSHYCLPLQGAESLLQAGQRVARHLEQRMRQLPRSAHDQATLKLFVGHGAAFRHAAYHLGLLRFEQIAQLSMHHCRPLCLEFGPMGCRRVAGDWKQRGIREQALD